MLKYVLSRCLFFTGGLFAIPFLYSTAVAQDVNIVFPADAGVYNVLDYGAIPGDGLDDLDAILDAMTAAGNANHIVYFPNGIYDVSGTIRISPTDHPTSDCGTCHKRVILQGQSRDSTIIRLLDDCPGFQDPNNRKGVIWMGTAPAQRFRNAIRNLTVSTGTGNPGAAGIQFVCNNQGTMRHIGIVSEDGQGVAGLDLAYTGEIGPGYIKDLYVNGFDYGVMSAAFNSMTFEKIRVENQNIAGFWGTSGVVSAIRDFKSNNSVQAILNQGVMTLVDAFLEGGESGSNGITNKSVLFVRNLSSGDYGMTIQNDAGHGIGSKETTIWEYTSDGVNSMFPSTGRSLNLPVKETPEIAWGDTADWVNITDFGAVGDNNVDCTQALQDAIDQPGAKTVYLPAILGSSAQYRINGTVYIRGSVERIIGCEARLTGSGKFIFDEGDAPAVIFERLDGIYNYVTIEHRASRALVISSVTGIDVTGYGSGDLFIEDYVSRIVLENPDQHFWGRQINTEQGDVTNILSNGATVWILGLKTEKAQIKINTKKGGATELLGAWIYAQQKEETEQPLFKVEDAQASFAGVKMTGFAYPYSELVYEEKNGYVRIWDWPANPGAVKAWGLYSAVDSDFQAPYPDPMQFHDPPQAAGCHSIRMEAKIAADSGEVEYAFECVSGPGHSSGWQNSPSYTDAGIPSGIACSYRVKARDISLALNETGWSTAAEATTLASGCLPAVRLEASDTLIAENSASSRTLTLTRDATTGGLTVYYHTGGSCLNSDFREDYTGRILLADGESTATLSFSPLNDHVTEPDKVFIMALLPGDGYEPADPHAVRIRLTDDDLTTSGLPGVNIKAVQPFASEQGRKPGVFEFSRTIPDGSLTVPLELGGTASIFDFTVLLPEQVKFRDGEYSVKLPVAPFMDNMAEGEEQLVLLIQPSGGYEIAEPDSAVMFVTDFESCTVIMEILDTFAVEEGMRPAKILLSRTGPLDDDLEVSFTLSGEAGLQDLHNQLTGFFTIPRGLPETIVTLTPEPDEQAEGEESLVITLQSREWFYEAGEPSSGKILILDTATLADLVQVPEAVEINLYPNPSRGEFMVTIPEPGRGQVIQVLDLTGRVIQTAEMPPYGSLRISLPDPKPGIYCIRILNRGIIKMKKLIVL